MRTLARLAAGAIVIAGVVLGSELISNGESESITAGEPAPPADIQAVISRMFVEGRCTTEGEAEERLRAVLLDLGHGDWTVSAEDGIAKDDCVTSSTLTLERRILLSAAARPEVEAVRKQVASDLLDRCFGKDEAIEHVTAMLNGVGEFGFQIVTNGPLAAPNERWDEAVRHYEAGCYVYSGSGRTEAGVPVYYVTGK